MINVPESTEKTKGSKLTEEDIDSLIDCIMNELENNHLITICNSPK